MEKILGKDGPGVTAAIDRTLSRKTFLSADGVVPRHLR